MVPVDGQAWETDPFEVVQKDGRYYGRGTCDMKGFDALAIWALVEAHHGGITRPLQIAFESEKFMLPIRLGTLNAKGKQDM